MTVQANSLIWLLNDNKPAIIIVPNCSKHELNLLFF